MGYDLDCAGVPLTIRIFPMLSQQWRIEARTTDTVDAVVVTATAQTRELALREVAQWWRDQIPSLGLPSLDWDGVAEAMLDVRAL